MAVNGDDDGDNINDDDDVRKDDDFQTFYFKLIYFQLTQFIAVYMKHK